MTPLTISSIVAAYIIFTCCFYLIWAERYEDGLIGRIALAGLGVNMLVMALDASFGKDVYDLLPTTALGIDCVAAFFVRHVWRFLRWSRTGQGEWRREAEFTGKTAPAVRPPRP